MNRFFYELNRKLIENEETIDHRDSVRQHRTNVRNIKSRLSYRLKQRKKTLSQTACHTRHSSRTTNAI